MAYPPPTRRAFLERIAKVALVSPLVPILRAHAAGAPGPRRLILFFTPQATYQKAWKPKGSETSFTLSPVLSPLANFQAKVNVLYGLHMTQNNFNGHTAGGRQLWTGSETPRGGPDNSPNRTFDYQYGPPQGPSVDQFVAKRIGAATAYPSLEFSIRTGQTVIYAGINQPVFGASDPRQAFSRLFAQVSTDTIKSRGSVLDVIARDLSRAQTMLDQADRSKLDQHLTAIRGLEKRLTTQQKACSGPKDLPQGNDAEYLTSMMDLTTSALACDLTRVVSLQFGQPDNDGDPYPFLGISGSHHDMTHHGSDTMDANGSGTSDRSRSVNGQLQSLYTWYSKMFAGLIGRLDAIPEGDGTMLDNTLILWGSELADYETHAFGPSMPFVSAGGANLGVKTGRFLDYGDFGQSHNRLLVSACNAMGLNDVTTFGNTDPGKGPLANF